MESVEIILEGSLRKSPPQNKGIFNKFESWRDRWFVLFRRHGEQQCELFYYSAADKKRCKGSIKLESVEAVTVADNEVLPNVFVIVADHKGKDRKYTLIAASDEERKKWVDHLVVACGLDTEPPPVQVAPIVPTEVVPIVPKVIDSVEPARPRAGSIGDALAIQSEQQKPSNTDQSSHLNVLTRSRDSSPTSSSTLTAGLDCGLERRDVKPEIPAKAATRLGHTTSGVPSMQPVPNEAKSLSNSLSRTAPQPSNAMTQFAESKNLFDRSARNGEDDIASYIILKPNQSSIPGGLNMTTAPRAVIDEEEEAPTYANTATNVAIQEEGNVYNNLPQSTVLNKTHSEKTKVGAPPVPTPRRTMSNKQKGPVPDVEYNVTPRNVPTNVAKQTDSDGLYNNPRGAVNSLYRMPNDQAALYNVPTSANSPSSPSTGSSVNREEEQSPASAFNLNMRIEGETEFGFFEPTSNVVTRKSPEFTAEEPNSDYMNVGAISKPQPDAADAESTYMNASVLPKAKPRANAPARPIDQDESSTLEVTAQPQPASKPLFSADSSADNFGANSPKLDHRLTWDKNPTVNSQFPSEGSVKSKAQAISNLARAQTEASTTKKAGWMAANAQTSSGIRQLSIDEAPPLPSRIVAPNVSDRFVISASFRRTRQENSGPYINMNTRSKQDNNAYESTRNSFQNARPDMLNIPNITQGGAISESDDSANED